jgi:3'-phosphoadenosine 5'-phosphosulfate sulfotransferase (PAPS reductase)/FAD synthetase
MSFARGICGQSDDFERLVGDPEVIWTGPQADQYREVSPRFGVMKINPLADWSGERVWQYLRRRKLPYHPLQDQNYPSVGCMQCTRPVNPGGRSAGRPLARIREN